MGFLNWKRGRERLNDMAMLSRLVADMRAQAPDHVAMTGDVLNIALPAEFAPAAAWMRTLGQPADVSFTPGNHDAYVRAAMPRLLATFAPWTSSDAGADGPVAFPYLRVRGEVALIGLCSGVPTGPLMATGRLGKDQIARLAELLAKTGAQGLARVVMIHHPPLTHGTAAMRSLTDARDFEQVVRQYGAEAILHGHNHKRMVNYLASSATRTRGRRIPILGVPSASATSTDYRQRAAYHLLRLSRRDQTWDFSIRARGLMQAGAEIVELDAPRL